MSPRTAAFALLLVLTAGAGAVLVSEAEADDRATDAETFQRLLNGLGFGPSLVLSPGPFYFDPRLDDGRAAEMEVIPGSAYFSPQKVDRIFSYPPLGNPLYPAEASE
jgi:hypothetical protein